MNKLKKLIQTIDWKRVAHLFILFCATFSIILYLVTNQTLESANLTASFERFRDIFFFLYGLAIFVLGIYLSHHLTKSFFLKLITITLLYLLISYGLHITRQINNEDFQIWDFSKNQFLEWRVFPTIGWIGLVALAVKYLWKDSSIFPTRQARSAEFEASSWVIYFLSPIFVFSDSKILNTIKEDVLGIINSGNIHDYLSQFLPNLFLAILGTALLTFMFFHSLGQLRKNKASFSLAVITSFLMALIVNYCLQLGVKGDTALLGRFIFEGATLYQILFFSVLYILVYAIINRYVLVTFILVSFSTIITVANFLKESMRSEPLLITDFVWVQDINLILSFVDKSYLFYLIGMIAIPVILYFFIRKRVLANPLVAKKRYRIAVIASLFSLIVGVFAVFMTEEDAKVIPGIPVVSKLNNWQDIEWFGFSVNARYKSLAYVWTKQLTKTVMEKPTGYSKAKMDDLNKKYSELAKKINQTRSEEISDQTVIYVLSESLADPARIPGVMVSQEVLPYIQELKKQTTSGLMVSDGYGGGTANMEFQSLTGLPFFNYSSSVSVLYTEVVPKMKVFPSISDQFDSENRLVLHPSGANNYSRKTIYDRLGFDRLIFSSDSDETFKNPERVGVSISDQTVYQNILDNIDTSKNQFFSIITMQNHAPWSVGNPVDVVAYGKDYTAEENDKLTEYSRLLTHTDQATQEFIEALSKLDKDITVVFYGDHLPGFYPTKAFVENPGSQFETDYFIWSNHDTKKMEEFPLVRSNDLTAELLQHTDSKVSPYYALLTFTLNQATMDSVDSDIDIDEATDDLKMLQYDISLGKGYIRENEDFFVIGDK